MTTQIITFLLSLLTPGLGYLWIGDYKKFYKTNLLFFSVITAAVILRLFIHFQGLFFIMFTLLSIHLFGAIHSTLKARPAAFNIKVAVASKILFTIFFILVTVFTFAGRRTVIGFDIMNMSVPVMQPEILQGDKFLIDTWAYKCYKPKRGDIVVHSFNNQKGLYVNRIIAVENDVIEVWNGVAVINGQSLKEPYVSSLNVLKQESKYMKETIVSKGCYFVMGDNRDASFGDSRFNGTINIYNIEGKITDIISSVDKSRIGITVK